MNKNFLLPIKFSDNLIQYISFHFIQLIRKDKLAGIVLVLGTPEFLHHLQNDIFEKIVKIIWKWAILSSA